MYRRQSLIQMGRANAGERASHVAQWPQSPSGDGDCNYRRGDSAKRNGECEKSAKFFLELFVARTVLSDLNGAGLTGRVLPQRYEGEQARMRAIILWILKRQCRPL